MGDADGGFDLIHILPPFSAGAIGCKIQVGRVNLDFDIFNLGQDGNGGGRSMDASLSLGLRNALHAVNSAFILKRPIGALTF